MIESTHLTLQDLETGLAAMQRSPATVGVLELIVRRPERGEREVCAAAILELDEGLVGDSWRARGSSGMPDGIADPDCQITLMNSRVIDLIAGDRGRWPLAGDQLYVDLDLSIDNAPPGTHVAIGSAILSVSDKPHTGCKKFAERFGTDAVRFLSTPEGRALNLRGINSRVITPGEIRAGDTVRRA